MYVWLLVAVVVAVGVLLLAGIVSPGDPADGAEDAGDPTPGSAWTSLWLDFRSGVSALRARLDRLRRRDGSGSAPDGGPRRVSVLAGPRPSQGRWTGRRQASGGRGTAESKDRDLVDEEPHASESNTSFDDFFEATATSEPAYLDTAQLSDALHHLRR
ncbi:hypothetical protein SAMN05216410_2146 [Sanguibacter gelidistatuariae]|uniref:Uncharacterized protein n=2 Tax=Sanguibacter gelidistatuariae TaxID=1814289 RepID=A0A1G6NJJ0_9MICO|nr:hypothetical protein SAMN05216410_2146 [Sanguibacter gelidistatuariae]